MELTVLSRRCRHIQVLGGLLILVLIADSVTGSPFLSRQSASQFLSSDSLGRVKRGRSQRHSGQAASFMELEGWQELILDVKRSVPAAPPRGRSRTLDALRRVQERVRGLLHTTELDAQPHQSQVKPEVAGDDESALLELLDGALPGVLRSVHKPAYHNEARPHGGADGGR